MGCLPGLLVFLLATFVGWLGAGPRGALWGAGAGVLLGGASFAWLARCIRARQHAGRAPGEKRK